MSDELGCVGEMKRRTIDWKKTGRNLRLLRNDNLSLRRYVCRTLRMRSGECDGVDCQNCRFEMSAHCHFDMTDLLFDMIRWPTFRDDYYLSYRNDEGTFLSTRIRFLTLCLISKRQSFLLSYKKESMTPTSYRRESHRKSERHFLLTKKKENIDMRVTAKNSRNSIISKGVSFL